VNKLYSELLAVRNNINETFETPRKVLPDLQKCFRLDGLDMYEDYILVQLATEKKFFRFSVN